MNPEKAPLMQRIMSARGGTIMTELAKRYPDLTRSDRRAMARAARKQIAKAASAK